MVLGLHDLENFKGNTTFWPLDRPSIRSEMTVRDVVNPTVPTLLLGGLGGTDIVYG